MAIKRQISKSRDAIDPFDNDFGVSSLSNESTEKTLKNTTYDVRPDILSVSELNEVEPELGVTVYETSSRTLKHFNGVEWVDLGGISEDLFIIERDENSEISKVVSKYDMKFPSPVIDTENQITTQYYDITSEDDGSLIDVKYEGNWYVNLPSIDNVDENFQVYVVHKQNQNVQGSITAYLGDLIDGNGSKKIYGQGFINLKKIKVGTDSYQWFVFNQVSYNTVEMQGKTRRFDFTNQSTIQLQHDLGFIPIVQVWIEDGEGGFVEVNVDIDHDWQTMNSLEISFGTPQTGKIIY